MLQQPQCLELLVADGGSSDALNQAFRAARGTLIGWLNADDLYSPGDLARAVAALDADPHWLMVYGEGEEFNAATGLRQRYPTLPGPQKVEAFRSHCFLCQPAVMFRRSMAVLLGPFDQHWRTAFDFDFWLRAFTFSPRRIGYLPHLQGCTRLHDATITSQ